MYPHLTLLTWTVTAALTALYWRSDGGGEFCVGFGSWGINCEHWPTSKCRRLATPDWLEGYWASYWAVHKVPLEILKEVSAPPDPQRICEHL